MTRLVLFLMAIPPSSPSPSPAESASTQATRTSTSAQPCVPTQGPTATSPTAVPRSTRAPTITTSPTQLVTDGVKDTAPPRWISTSSSLNGVLPKNEREWLVDDNPVTALQLKGPRAWVQLELGGGDSPLEFDRLDVDARATPLENWTVIVSGSGDGQTWTELGRAESIDAKGDASVPSWRTVRFNAPSRARCFRVDYDGPGVRMWSAGNVRFFMGASRVRVGGPFHSPARGRARTRASSGSTSTSALPARSIASRCTGSAAPKKVPFSFRGRPRVENGSVARRF